MDKRKNIGLLIDDINGSYQTPIWLNFKYRAEQLDCNLITFEGKRLGSDTLLFSEKQHNFIYKLIDKSSIDGLIIISGPQINFIGLERFLDFCKQFEDIPVISIGIEIPGALNLLVDGKIGMKELIQHLLDFHNYKKIGFLKGPNNNTEANERFEAYLEVLNENNIPVDNNLIFEGEFTLESGYRTADNIFLNNIQLDALVCANDNMAVGALNSLKTLNMSFEKSFYITGFDDAPSLKYFNYPLTTVRQPIEEIVNYSLRFFIDRNVELNNTIYMPSRLVKRSTCGCMPDYPEEDAVNTEVSENMNVEYKFHELLQTYSMEELYDEITKILNQFSIKGCFIVKYSDGPVIYKDDSAEMPENSELIYAYQNYKRLKEIPEELKYFSTKEILPKKFITNCERFTYLINPLFFKNEHSGYIVFCVNNNDVTNYESLRGNIINALKIASLNSDNLEKQNRLIKREKLAALGEISRELANAIKDPTNTIESNLNVLLELLEKYAGENAASNAIEEIRTDISGIINTSKESSKKIINIANSFKKQTLSVIMDSMEEFKIGSIFDELALLNDNPRCKLAISNHFDRKLKTDRIKLHYIISSIVQNSIEAYNESTGTIEITAKENEGNLLISIKDFAGGIPDKVGEQIFKKCFLKSGSSKGTGLGLYVSNILVKNYFNGDISFEPKSGSGTVFIISIPLKRII